MHDFGYAALNMKYVNPEDSGMTMRLLRMSNVREKLKTMFWYYRCIHLQSN